MTALVNVVRDKALLRGCAADVARGQLTTGVPPPQGSLLPCTREAFAEFDALLVATAHDQFKDPRLWGGVKLVVDTRNMVEPLFGEGVAGGPKRLVKA